MSVCTTDGWVSVFWFETVGNDSSSATKGSSITIVAGKKRDPAKPWANALTVGKIVSAPARTSLARPFELTASIESFRFRREQAIGVAAPPEGAAAIRQSGEEVALGSRRRRAGADGPRQSTCGSLRGRREDGPRSDKRDRFKFRVGN